MSIRVGRCAAKVKRARAVPRQDSIKGRILTEFAKNCTRWRLGGLPRFSPDLKPAGYNSV
jgi:hypothetical protein